MVTRRRPARRQARQQRAQNTVEVIVEATTRVLLRDGYEACSTNRVAKAAGVSVGSLYQYFPNKESLVVAVMERHQATMHAAFTERLKTLHASTVGGAVKDIVRDLFEVQRKHARLQRVLFEQVPRIGALKRLHELTSQYEPLVIAWFEEHKKDLDLDNASVAAYVLIAAVEGVVTRVVLERPSWIEGPVLEDQVARLVLSYLSPRDAERRR
jgi:AcrR family transcriptional regulator